MIDQLLDAICRVSAWRIRVVKRSIAYRGSRSLEMNVVFDQNAKASKARVKGCFGLDLGLQRKAGELAIGASQLECFERVRLTIEDENRSKDKP